jgi:hypothetical protein
MKKIYFVSVVISLLLSQSCTEKSYDIFLTQKVENHFSNELINLYAVVILPNQGCGGCISEVENFLLHNSEKYTNIKYVLTKIVSKKILKQKLGDSIYYSPNVYIDNENFFASTSFRESIYPAILYLKNGKIKNIKYQNPDNPEAMLELSDWLSK